MKTIAGGLTANHLVYIKMKEKFKIIMCLLLAAGLAIGVTYLVQYLCGIESLVEYIPMRIAIPVAAESLLFGGAFAIIRLIERKPSLALGFTRKNIAAQLGWGAVLLIGLTFAFTALPYITGGASLPEKENLAISVPYRLIFVGFAEETLFCGLILSALDRLTNSKLFDALGSAFLFGAWHIINSGSIYRAVISGLCGLVLALPRVYAENCTTLSTSLAHGAYDALLGVLSWL